MEILILLLLAIIIIDLVLNDFKEMFRKENLSSKHKTNERNWQQSLHK